MIYRYEAWYRGMGVEKSSLVALSTYWMIPCNFCHEFESLMLSIFGDNILTTELIIVNYEIHVVHTFKIHKRFFVMILNA